MAGIAPLYEENQPASDWRALWGVLPPVLLRAVADFAFLAAGEGGSDPEGRAFRFVPEAPLFCAV